MYGSAESQFVAYTNIESVPSLAEITLLREQCAAISEKKETLVKEEHSHKQELRNAKRSVLRSFDWREKNVDAAVLRGVVAF